MYRAGDDDKFFIVACQLGEGVLAEVEGVGLVAVYEHNGALDFRAVGQQRHIHEGVGIGGRAAAVGVQRALVVAALRFVRVNGDGSV